MTDETILKYNSPALRVMANLISLIIIASDYFLWDVMKIKILI